MDDVIPEWEITASHHISSLFWRSPGSVLRSNLFNLYTAEIHRVITVTHALVLHRFADDCQVYISTPVADAVYATDQLVRCLEVSGRMDEVQSPEAEPSQDLHYVALPQQNFDI